MKKIIVCKACNSEYCDESFDMDWDNDNPLNPLDKGLIDCCPACGCTEFLEDSYYNICYKGSRCSGWNKSMDRLQDQQVFCSIQSAAPKYTGEKFKYCPWCGEKITKK